MILLSTDILELKANAKKSASGTVLEAKLDRGRGPVATVLVQDGTLNVGDNLIAGPVVGRNVPGVHVPDSVIRRLAGAERPKQEGVAIAVELVQQLREMRGVAGVHLMAFKMEEFVPEIVERAGVLGPRIPWFPDRDKRLAEKKATA